MRIMLEIIKLNTTHHSLIWGSEQWLISAHENGDNKISDLDISLSEFYRENKSFFGNCPCEVFPLLVKIIDAKTQLSVQVHPDDLYAKLNENSLGKTECWYVMNEEPSEIIIGQNSHNRDELKKEIENNNIMNCLNTVKVQKGDFFYIPAGVVHAIGSNTKILEIQQSSDITYRLYDYERVDSLGQKRDLHISKSLDVINYDYNFEKQRIESIKEQNCIVTNYTNNEFFNVMKVDVVEQYICNSNKYFTMGICLDDFVVNGVCFSKDESFIVGSNVQLVIKGMGEIFISTYGEVK